MLVIAIVAAVLTPTPDATTMLVFMGVLTALYVVGIGVSWVVVRRKAKQDAGRSEAR
jgi:Sec-independent protein secretion pathway component TatC